MNEKKRMLKFLWLLGLCVSACFSYAQDKITQPVFSRELSFTTENDAYLFGKHDAFYTNGFFIRLSTAGSKKGNKIIQSWELGQMIYTPLIRKTIVPADIDRPYCGFLFGKYSRPRFLKNDAVLQ